MTPAITTLTAVEAPVDSTAVAESSNSQHEIPVTPSRHQPSSNWFLPSMQQQVQLHTEIHMHT
ncbi:hypothetical protein BDQ17DRAFT_422345 [Cyathus striatus]|nr:hypothetical protein BDQ17DRAFT_422345 [Cyathus striatus]